MNGLLSPFGPSGELRTILIRAFQLLAIGLLVGLACWPLNLIDSQVDHLLARFPAFQSGASVPWGGVPLRMALAPVALMPCLLWLKASSFRSGSGSGIPDTMVAIEDPDQATNRLSADSTIKRMTLWSVASFALFPLGREGPVVQVGAAVTQALRQRWPRLVADIAPGQLLAVGAGAGLAAAFNTPTVAVVFILEELLGQLQARLVWPALVVCSVAAGLSNLLGQPQFALGEVTAPIPELDQLFWAVPIGCGGGLVGGLFSRALVAATGWVSPRAAQRPWLWGVLLGAGISGLLLWSGGTAGGDGEALLKALIDPDKVVVQAWIEQPIGALVQMLQRLVGPILALSAGVPGGLIDPALTLGAMAGNVIMTLTGHDRLIGVVLGMAAGLAGATQLPLVTIAFAVRLMGDQTFMPGLVLASAIGALSGRLMLRQPVYHALAALQRAPRR